MDEPERREPFQPRQEEPSPQSDVEESSANGGPDPDGAEVMGRLPRTRPQRRTGRRPAGAKKASSPTPPKPKPAAGTRRRATAKVGARSGSSSSARKRPAAGETQARRRPAQTATRVAARKRAPGIPQLAAEAALGAAKLPLKATASITRQGAKLIGRGLRLR